MLPFAPAQLSPVRLEASFSNFLQGLPDLLGSRSDQVEIATSRAEQSGAAASLCQQDLQG